MIASNLKRSDPLTSIDAKPLASISLDLDNQWSYMKTHGDSGWEKFPSYFEVFIPHVLDLLDHLNLKITFFIVGQDAALDKNKDVLKLLTERGHEVGNHSFHHEPWLHLYEKDQMKKEILETEDQIIRVTGQKPIGFRGPGFSWSLDLLKVLTENGYFYDASTLPTYIGPLAKIYYFRKSRFTEEERERRARLFGGFKEGLKSIKPHYLLTIDGKRLLEIPVTTMPFFKTPFHMSYLIYLSRFSPRIMQFYLKITLALCLMTRTNPSFLLHPLDFLDRKQVPDLAFFPGMDVDVSRKLEIFSQVMEIFSKYFTFVDMRTYAQSALEHDR